jgi:ABC-type nickel/cobalt efflux system permease component RcnA
MPIRAEFLNELLHRGEIGWGLLATGLAVAFVLGALHALSPGHGKAIVAAYLVGTRGTARHALFLGGMVTFTHTISVFALGFVTLFLSHRVSPDKIFPVLGAVSGLTIVWVGTTLLYKRAGKLWAGGRHHHHDHSHHHHDHEHDHSHIPEGDVTLASLIALGASGGLVPCPSALVLLLSSIALRRVGLGLILLVAFSAGLALVLMAIGLMVIYAKHLLPVGNGRPVPAALRLIPVFSAGVIVCIGLFMTAISLGLVRPGFALS